MVHGGWCDGEAVPCTTSQDPQRGTRQALLRVCTMLKVRKSKWVTETVTKPYKRPL
jgi:hypothetical protein